MFPERSSAAPNGTPATPGTGTQLFSPLTPILKLNRTPTLKDTPRSLKPRDMDLSSPQYKRVKPDGVKESRLSGGSDGSRLSEGFDVKEGSKRKRGGKMKGESLSSLSST